MVIRNVETEVRGKNLSVSLAQLLAYVALINHAVSSLSFDCINNKSIEHGQSVLTELPNQYLNCCLREYMRFRRGPFITLGKQRGLMTFHRTVIIPVNTFCPKLFRSFRRKLLEAA